MIRKVTELHAPEIDIPILPMMKAQGNKILRRLIDMHARVPVKANLKQANVFENRCSQ